VRTSVATLTLNPAIDRLLEVERLSEGDANRVVHEKHYAAGKGIDGARVIHTLGGTPLSVALQGGVTGRELKLRLRREGVRSLFIAIPGETRTNIVLYDRATSRQYVLNAAGPNAAPGAFENAILALRKEQPGAVIAAGSLPVHLPLDAYLTLIGQLHPLPVFLDTDGEPLALALAGKPAGIKPNRREAERLLGNTITTDADALAAAAALAAKGICHVILSLGKAGAVLAHEGKLWRGHSPKVNALSSVGAGDALLAAYVYKLQCGLPPPEALRWGLAAGAASALRPGTELCRLEDVERLLPEARVEQA
jgi:1-phosphofructokinase family hexose kinase